MLGAMNSYTVECKRSGGDTYAVRVPSQSADSAMALATARGHSPTGIIDENPVVIPASSPGGAVALAFAWFGLLAPVFAVVGIALSAGKKDRAAGKARVVGWLALFAWCMLGIGVFVWFQNIHAAAERNASRDAAIADIERRIHEIGK